MRRFRRIYRSENVSEEQNPMIFIYLSEFFMSRIAQQVIPALAPYQESFDIYYTNDQ